MCHHPVASSSAAGVPWRLSCSAFTGRERDGEEVPPWAADAVLRGELPFVKELKSAFVLQPAEGSGLPSLLQSRLNAPRILQVLKVRAPTICVSHSTCVMCMCVYSMCTHVYYNMFLFICILLQCVLPTAAYAQHITLPTSQVANYCTAKLGELSVPLIVHEVGCTPESQLPPPAATTAAEAPQQQQQYLELTCNGQVRTL
jgi:hypothetical protein